MTVSEYAEKIINSPQSWMLLPPGKTAICRYAVPLAKPPEACCFEGLTGIRRATNFELLAANLGKQFPWGSKADPKPHEVSRLWREQYIGIGGLVHTHWFVTADGNRYGGADNVCKEMPGRLRCYMYLPGGLPSETLADNEGYALVKEVEVENERLYHRVHAQVREHMGADEGGVILSPLTEGNTVFIGFAGKCQQCWNPESITVKQIRKSIPSYNLVLMDEWKDWMP